MTQVKAHIGKEHYKTVITSPSNKIIADEPIDLGGTDLGFSPAELMASSLASCTAITLRMYSDRNNWEISSIEVTVNFERDPASNTSQFIREITLYGNVDEKQKTKLLSIANACPMHKVLTGNIKVDTKLL